MGITLPYRQCPRCERKMSEYLIHAAYVNGHYETLCPLCYAERHKEIHGMKWNPVGAMASSYFEEAKNLFPDWSQ